ncbi:MAG TPA: PBP1A family penicillin-binding protein [Pyrinomonadaceae bacterium]
MATREISLPRTSEIRTERVSRRWTAFLWLPLALILALAAGGVTGVLASFYVNNSRAAQEVSALATYRPSTVTKVYADDGETVIAEFALEKRLPVREKDIPKKVEDAILAIEDTRFYKHMGIDPYRIAGAAYKNIRTGSFEGASTLTQQIARNLFLTRAQTFERKINEWLVALQIERFYTKRQILEMYYNNFFLGAGAYGFEAASRTYFGKPAKDLSIEEAALLAAIPKSPTTYSPTINPAKALERRNLVISEMAEQGSISKSEADAAKAKPIKLADTAYYQSQQRSSPYDYPIEEIRKYLEEKYTTRVAQGGLEVYSTINADAQELATKVVREKLRAYDRSRSVWNSNYKMIPAKEEGNPTEKELEAFKHPDWYGDDYEKGDYVKGLVMKVDAGKNEAAVRFGKYNVIVTAKDMGWSRRQPKDEFRPGLLAEFEILEVNQDAKTLKLQLSQVPEIQASLVCENAKNGEIVAMVGGYDFHTNKFNNATQGLRQTGSAYKPYVYTAAIEWGMTPEMPVSGAPIRRGGWSPQNYDGSHSHGTVPLKTALAKSYNVAAVHLLEQVGVQTGAQMVRRFGITHPMSPNLASALGASEVPLVEMVSAYSAFPNRGIRVEPHLIRKVINNDGNVLEQWENTTYKVTSEYVALTMVEMMRGVVQAGGTATGANAAGHPLAGKTGTVNDHTDVWFIGYTPTYVTGIWMGNPERKESLGRGMTGGHGAVPYFSAFMSQFMKDKKHETFPDAPPMPADIKALNEQRSREELEKREEESFAVSNRVYTGTRRSKSNGDLEFSVDTDIKSDSNAPATLERDTLPGSKRDDDEPPPPVKSSVEIKPATNLPKKPETPAPKTDKPASDDSRPRTVEPPKKQGKKGNDEP